MIVVVVVALTHRGLPPVQAVYGNPSAAYGTTAPLNSYGNPQAGYPAQPAALDQYGNPAPVAPGPAASYGNYGGGHVVYSASPFGSEPVVEQAPPPPPPIVAQEPAPVYESAPPRYHYRHGHRYVVTRRRPFSHSVAIVGGSAAGGAAIGAIAGGGEGAAIGALAGGAGGFIYDRLTHKKKVVVER